MLIWTCIIMNLINAVLFTVKNKRTVALVYYFSIFILAFLSLFYIKSEIMVDLLQSGLGARFYDDLNYALHASDFIMLPHLGVLALSIIAALTILLKSAEIAVKTRKRKCHFTKRVHDIINKRETDTTIVLVDKKYLFNCVILC